MDILENFLREALQVPITIPFQLDYSGGMLPFLLHNVIQRLIHFGKVINNQIGLKAFPHESVLRLQAIVKGVQEFETKPVFSGIRIPQPSLDLLDVSITPNEGLERSAQNLNRQRGLSRHVFFLALDDWTVLVPESCRPSRTHSARLGARSFGWGRAFDRHLSHWSLRMLPLRVEG
jgi:hypothetical protein